MTQNDRQTHRIRHEAARRRTLTVAEKTYLAPSYLSIRFACDDFGDFASASADDHIKLFLAGERSEGQRPPMRDYTPRAFDPEQGSFVIDFALHDDPGPATAWAIAAQPGDRVEIGGPRGSVVISGLYSDYWLIGDEAAIPSIMRRMSEWLERRIHALIAVADETEQVPIPASASHRIRWVHRKASDAANSAALTSALGDWFQPGPDAFVWIAAEAGVTKNLREAILATGHPVTQMKASGYWTSGMADTTAKFD